jgi:hypothetical protein
MRKTLYNIEAAQPYGWRSDLSDEDILEKLLALNLERSGRHVVLSIATFPGTARHIVPTLFRECSEDL